MFDTVMAGIEWFGKPQPGDAIVVIAADMEGSRKANARMVAKALLDNHIRMFGLALGPVQTKSSVASGFTTAASSQGLAQSEPLVGELVYQTGDENFFPLTTNSGGLVLSVMNADPRRTYRMDDPRMVQSVRQKARSVANMISAYYRMQVEPPQIARPENWALRLNKKSRNRHSLCLSFTLTNSAPAKTIYFRLDIAAAIQISDIEFREGDRLPGWAFCLRLQPIQRTKVAGLSRRFSGNLNATNPGPGVHTRIATYLWRV
ncbi:MAG: hypothetical protein WA672_18530 [Candidatus Angelobacter sp.]